jgi:hypothetical protein
VLRWQWVRFRNRSRRSPSAKNSVADRILASTLWAPERQNKRRIEKQRERFPRVCESPNVPPPSRVGPNSCPEVVAAIFAAIRQEQCSPRREQDGSCSPGIEGGALAIAQQCQMGVAGYTGGLSTGPKTPAGIERIRRGVTKHGRYSVRATTERRLFRQLVRDTRDVLAGLLGN